MYEFIKSIIATRNYNLASLEERIQKMYLLGKLTAAEMQELLDLANANVNDTLQIDIAATLANLEQRISALESAGVKVWVSGMITAKGQTVLYDVDSDGVLDKCRYDGGRASTSLSPGKINGWVKTDGNGNVTHTIEKDDNGNIILVPAAQAE